MLISLLALFCLEITIRVVSTFIPIYNLEMWKYARTLKVRSTNPNISHVHKTNTTAKLMGVEVSLNSLGHRSRELQNPKKDNEKRIHFLGSSIVLGWGVAEEEDFASVLVDRLNEVELFKKQVNATAPDLVVLQYYLNDAEVKPKVSRNVLLRYSMAAALIDFSMKTLSSRSTQTLADYYADLYKEGQPGWEQTKSSLRELKLLCEKRNIPLVVVLIPDLHDLSEKNPYLKLYEKIIATLQRMEIHTINTYPALHEVFGKNSKEAYVQRDDPHPSAKTHHIIADEIFNDLKNISF